MQRPESTMLAGFAMVLLAACGGEPKQEANAPGPPPTQTTLTSATKPMNASPGLRVSDDLAKKCGLHFNDEGQAPKYETDEAELTAADRDILQQIAICMTTGPLKGQNVQLVGRADPRGANQYNMVLGARRSNSVNTHLTGLGVAASRMQVTSRGELDAKGEDEASWQNDRRVDILLAK